MPCKDEELFWRWMGSVQRAGEGASQSSDGSRDRFHLSGCYTTEDMAENFQAFDTSAAFVQRARTELALPLRHFQQKMLHTPGDLREHWDKINKSLPITDQRVLKHELRSLGVAFDALFPSPWNPQLKGAQGVQKAAQCEATLRQVVLVEAGKGPSPNEPSTINIQEHVYALRERYASASREYTDQLAEASKELRKVLTLLADLQVLTIGKNTPSLILICAPHSSKQDYFLPGQRHGLHGCGAWTLHALSACPHLGCDAFPHHADCHAIEVLRMLSTPRGGAAVTFAGFGNF